MQGFSGRNLGCVRGERRVFAALDFEVAPGHALLLTGSNGSGKSSLLRIMTGLLPAETGTLLWDGTDIAEDEDAHRTRLAYVGHADPIKPVLSVRDNLVFWARLNGLDVDGDAALTRFGIDHLAELPARHLSAGQRRRLNLARLALGQDSPAGPPLWLLDEPATGLDTAAVAKLIDTALAHLSQGGIVVVSTHGGALDEALGAHGTRLDLAPFAQGAREAA